MNKTLALVGMPGSGKSTAAEYFGTHGWFILRFGQLTIDEIIARGQEVDERNERAIREEFRRIHGPAAYAKLALPKILEARKTSQVIIDGLYSWAEYKLLHEALRGDLLVIAIAAARPIRYARLHARPERPLTLEEVTRRDYSEIENLDKGGPIAIADYTIVNDGTHEELRESIERAMRFFAEHP